jgi:hypothetical protein
MKEHRYMMRNADEGMEYYVSTQRTNVREKISIADTRTTCTPIEDLPSIVAISSHNILPIHLVAVEWQLFDSVILGKPEFAPWVAIGPNSAWFQHVF